MNSSLQFHVLSNEKQDDFDTLFAAMAAEFQPAGEHETFLVELMAQARWRLRRIQRIETAAFDGMLTAPAAERNADRFLANRMFNDPASFSMLQKLASAAERSYHKAHAELVKARQSRAETKTVEHLDAAVLKRIVEAPIPTARHAGQPSEPAAYAVATVEHPLASDRQTRQPSVRPAAACA